MRQRADFLSSDTSFSTKVTNFVFGDQRINSWGVWTISVLITVGLAYIMAKVGIVLPLLLIILIVAAPIALSAMWNTQIGIYIMIGFAYFLGVANRLLPNIPMGIALDLMILIMLLGLLYRCYDRKDWSPFQSPISVALALWGGMNLLEFANPIAASRAAWFYVIRPALGYMMLYFLTYSMISRRTQLNNLLFFFLSLNLITALWGIYQYFFGYFDWEMAHIIRNDAVHLVFNDGRWRSFGSIGSPAQYGILMAYTGSISFTNRLWEGLPEVFSGSLRHQLYSCHVVFRYAFLVCDTRGVLFFLGAYRPETQIVSYDPCRSYWAGVPGKRENQ